MDVKFVKTAEAASVGDVMMKKLLDHILTIAIPENSREFVWKQMMWHRKMLFWKQKIRKEGGYIGKFQINFMKRSGAKQLLVFTSTWCTACLDLKTRLEKIDHPLVLGAIVYDIEEDNSVFKSWGVYTIPVLILVDATHQEISRITSPTDVRLIKFLQ